MAGEAGGAVPRPRGRRRPGPEGGRGHGRLAPFAYPLREDFPDDLPHLNLSRGGEPRSLCLFEMPPDEALRIATPHVLLERVRWWLTETAHGRLHGEHQPLDPVFGDSGLALILPQSGTHELDGGTMVGVAADERSGSPVVLAAAAPSRVEERLLYTTVAVATAPAAHGRIRELPETLADLIQTYAGLGVDLAGLLRDAFRGWTNRRDVMTLLRRPCILVVSTPVEREPGRVGQTTTKAFHTTPHKTSEVVEALGALRLAGGHVSRPFPDVPPDAGAMRRIVMSTLDVHPNMSRQLARAASGRTALPDDDRTMTLVGAGALGSQLALAAARMGIGRWTVVDPDHVMPHNLARHALLSGHIAMAKAEALAAEVKAMLGDDAAAAVVGDARGADAAPALSAADLVVDASASVPVARWLARQSGHAAPTTSAFLNPRGRDLVVLKEGAGRVPRVDQVEMSYHWLLASNDRLADHLESPGDGIHPSGGCRAPSLQIAQSRVGALASVAVESVFDPVPADGAVEVWRSSSEGIEVIRATPARHRDGTVADCTISVSEDVIEAMTAARRKAGEDETGGILVGSWDRLRNVLYLVATLDAPPDSVASRTGFVRGSAGVYATLDDIERRTAANLTYVGEWHTHPPRHGTGPSGDDRVLLEWIGHVLAHSDVPACMAIAGEDGVRIILGRHDQSTLFA